MAACHKNHTERQEERRQNPVIGNPKSVHVLHFKRNLSIRRVVNLEFFGVQTVGEPAKCMSDEKHVPFWPGPRFT